MTKNSNICLEKEYDSINNYLEIGIDEVGRGLFLEECIVRVLFYLKGRILNMKLLKIVKIFK